MRTRPSFAGGLSRLDWKSIVIEAAKIVARYDTLVTLLQLFYQLVVRFLIPNNVNAYKRLSDVTATARRAGEFPELTDNNRSIHRFRTWTSPREAALQIARAYRRDRTEGQSVSLYLGVEKNWMLPQLLDWFGDLGIPIAPGAANVTGMAPVDPMATRANIRADAALIARPSLGWRRPTMNSPGTALRSRSRIRRR
jgi:hypothetical protein